MTHEAWSGGPGVVQWARSRVRPCVVGALLLLAAPRAGADPCTIVPVYDEGSVTGSVCAEQTGIGLTLVSLDDAWMPRVLSETAELPQAYRATFQALANERLEDATITPEQQRDHYFELFGIFPSISVIRRRLLDAERHDCHARVDDVALRALTQSLTPWDPRPSPSRSPARRAALAALQAHLVCERLLPADKQAGAFDAATVAALASYQRLHMIPSPAVLDAATRDTLLTPSRELDFRALLRALRERVSDALGWIEDGSASNAWAPVFGRYIDAAEYRHPLRPAPLEWAAGDLVSGATESTASALGWVSPEAAATALGELSAGIVAVPAPVAPAYYGAPLSLRVEIDRGDVWSEYPFDDRGQALPSPVVHRPTLTVYARTSTGDVPLVRWPTTIGGWQRENAGEGRVVLRYKPSPTGDFVWRELIAAPAWFPPASTPDRELVRRLPDGRLGANLRAVGPGYASAYGLVALLHHRRAPGDSRAVDVNVRTHGSGSYRTILRGTSHGCHRLFNHLAIRLGSFLLAHGQAVRHGQSSEQYTRVVHARGGSYRLHASSRGYRFELSPPIDVQVLPGRRVRSHPASVAATPLPAPSSEPPVVELDECG